MIFILSSFHAVKNLSVYSFALLGSALYLPVLTSTLQSSLNCSSSNKVREIAFHLTSDCRIIKMIHLSFYHEKLKYCNKGSSQSEIKRTRSIKNSLSQFSQKNFKWKDILFHKSAKMLMNKRLQDASQGWLCCVSYRSKCQNRGFLDIWLSLYWQARVQVQVQALLQSPNNWKKITVRNVS